MDKNSKRLIIGITGSSCSGKNVVSDFLKEKDFELLDCDKIVHKLLEQNLKTIIQLFGDDAKKKNLSLTNLDGSLNRKALSQILFSDLKALREHEEWILPATENEVFKAIDESPNKNFAINGAVLHKTNIPSRCKCIIFVKAPLLIRLIRAKKRDKISFMRIFKRFYSQKGLFSQYFKKNTDIYIVSNFGSKKTLQRKIFKVLDLFRR